jgi:hypothetical protein
MVHIGRCAAVCCVALAVATGAEAQFRPQTRLMGFADFSYVMTNRDGAAEGFREGQLVGHVLSELSERVHFFSEVSATAIQGGFRVEVERAGIQYDFRDALKVSAGRTHTPMTYWNTAYHHGHWLQTSIGRPEMIRGGGTFLPVHFVGIGLEGSLPSSGLGYQAGVGNGRNATFVRGGDEGEKSFRPAYHVGGHLRPAFLSGLQLGVAGYFDSPTDVNGLEIRERAVSVHLVHEGRSPELLLEYARVGHMRADSGGWSWGSGGYVQTGYRLPGRADALTPYLRWESVRVPAGDAMIPAGSSYRAWLGGMRYDLTGALAVKGEYRLERSGEGRFRSFVMELAYTFPGPASEPGDPVTAGHH